MKRVLEDLTFSDYGGGVGPLLLAVWLGWRAWRADTAFDRWMWVAAALVMVVICVVFVVWVVRRRRAEARATE